MNRPKTDTLLRERVQERFRQSKSADKYRYEDERAGIILDPDVYLYAGDPTGKTIAFLSKRWITIGSGFLGLMSCVMSRITARKPVRSAIHWYPITIGASMFIGSYLEEKLHESMAERDLQYLHYMRLNPRDFPPPQRVKYADYLEPWTPHR